MAILALSGELGSAISQDVERLNGCPQESFDTFFNTDTNIKLLWEKISVILENNDFVLIRNIGFNDNEPAFVAFVKMFGRYYGRVEQTGILVERLYTGCDYNTLDLHTDDAIAECPPRFTAIQVTTPDPAGGSFGWNGIVKIDDVEKCLAIELPEVHQILFNTSFPMRSVGVSAQSEDQSVIECCFPILTIRDERINVRYDPSRILHYYYKNNAKMPEAMRNVLHYFNETCQRFRKRYFLNVGDILVLNNHRVLHDREETTMELNPDGTLNSRRIMVSFAYENIVVVPS